MHNDCKKQLSIVCVPQSVGTPTVKGAMGCIGDYAPTNSPMVPGIIVHCINEVSADCPMEFLDIFSLFRLHNRSKVEA